MAKLKFDVGNTNPTAPLVKFDDFELGKVYRYVRGTGRDPEGFEEVFYFSVGNGAVTMNGPDAGNYEPISPHARFVETDSIVAWKDDVE